MAMMPALLMASCVTPRMPAPSHPPAPDRYERAADPDPAARARAADELAFDPSPQAAQMLLVLHRRDVDPDVRSQAAAAILQRRDPSLESSLEVAAATDPDPAVRDASASAYRRLHAWRKRPGIAAGLSLLCPGCGQLYLGEWEGAAQLGAAAALVGTSIGLLAGQEQVGLDEPARSARVPIALPLLIAAQNLWFYSIFDAYRDARVMRGDTGYRHAITRESLGDLASAPFRPKVLARPWVWGGVPLALGAGIFVSWLASRGDGESRPTISDVREVNVLGRNFSRGAGFAAGSAYFASLFVPVGVGEEALFRGLIQTELEERLGTWGGLAAASVIFGAVHVFNFLDDPKSAGLAVPVITVLGSSMGLAYIRTGHQLETSVAMHFWYDLLLSAAAFAADPTHQPFVVQYGTPM
jgi:membrane protease YdiL (CAAX protease family)